MLEQGCGKTVLARGPCAEVTRCTCGHIHLEMGPVSIRMEEEVLRAIGQTVTEALQQLSALAPVAEDSPLPSGGWKQ